MIRQRTVATSNVVAAPEQKMRTSVKGEEREVYDMNRQTQVHEIALC